LLNLLETPGMSKAGVVNPTGPEQASRSSRDTGAWVKVKRAFKRFLYLSIGVGVAAGAVLAYKIFTAPALPPGIAGGNGRLEANQLYVATKYPGRIAEILFNEGDAVESGQVVARMDTSALDAQLREAQAEIRAAQDRRNTALAQVDVKKADFDYAQKQSERSKQLVTTGAISEQEAEVDAAHAAASRAELVGAQAEATRALSSIAAATATADRLRAEIKDAVLVSPLRSRVETRLAEPGEVLGQGGRVFTINDLSDVYMYVFLPNEVAGKVPLGSEARIVLDAYPSYPIRATVSFISPMAQFTPKAVETAEERYNLTFRIKLQLDKDRLREYEPFVKSGLPGMGYVRTDPSIDWPQNLQVKPIPDNLLNATGAAVVSGGPN
jgi:HlyD family secretion protein